MQNDILLLMCISAKHMHSYSVRIMKSDFFSNIHICYFRAHYFYHYVYVYHALMSQKIKLLFHDGFILKAV